MALSENKGQLMREKINNQYEKKIRNTFICLEDKQISRVIVIDMYLSHKAYQLSL